MTTSPTAAGATSTVRPAASDPAAVSTERTRTTAVLSWLGGACLITAPLLITGAMATVPPKASSSPADYVASMADHPVLTSISASLFHYGWLLLGFGVLAAIGLLRGPRGRVPVVLGALGTAFGCMQMSGLLLLDWYTVALGQNLPSADAVRVDQAVGDAATDVWFASAKIGALLLPVVLYLGLARAGVIPWWIAPLSLCTLIVPGLLPAALAVPVGLLCWAPTFLVGYRLIARARAHAASVG